jgi:fructose-bisphosphate aldolase class I
VITTTDTSIVYPSTASLNPLHAVAAALVTRGKGILAADESNSTMNSRLSGVDVAPEQQNRNDYRELLLTAPGLSRGVSGAILYDETLRATMRDGRPFPDRMRADGLLVGIKVDTGTVPLALAEGEKVTEGLDGLRERLAEYRELGASFAKWRAVFAVDQRRPSPQAISANVQALARYAAACQEQGIVPIVEPEVLMDGGHHLARAAVVQTRVLSALFRELVKAGVDLRAIVLKPSMVLSGSGCPDQAGPAEVAEHTVAVLQATVPPSVPGVAFLSGGQSPERATANLAAMQRLTTSWALTFSFGRALVDPALRAWHGEPDLWAEGQSALLARVEANHAALLAG